MKNRLSKIEYEHKTSAGSAIQIVVAEDPPQPGDSPDQKRGGSITIYITPDDARL